MKNVNQNSFTIIELIIVIAAIAILVAVVAPIVMHSLDKAKIPEMGKVIHVVKNGALNHYADTGIWKGESDCVDAVGVKVNLFPQFNCITWEESFFMTDLGSEGWDGPYLSVVPGLNPWGYSYAYMTAITSYIFVDGYNSMQTMFNPGVRTLTSRVISLRIQKEIDNMLDDGNLNSGDIRNAEIHGSFDKVNSGALIVHMISSDGRIRESNEGLKFETK